MDIIKAFDDFIDNKILKTIPQKDYEPKNWEIGDYIRCNSNVEGQFIKGNIYKIIGLDLRPNFMIVKTLDSEGKENGWCIERFDLYSINHEYILA